MNGTDDGHEAEKRCVRKWRGRQGAREMSMRTLVSFVLAPIGPDRCRGRASLHMTAKGEIGRSPVRAVWGGGGGGGCSTHLFQVRYVQEAKQSYDLLIDTKNARLGILYVYVKGVRMAMDQLKGDSKGGRISREKRMESFSQ